MRARVLLAGVAVLALLTPIDAGAMPVSIFTDTFNGGANNAGATTFGAGVSGGFSGVITTEAVPGSLFTIAPGFSFQGDYLRNTATGNPATMTKLILTGLGAHTAVSLDFLLAIIDTWDGNNCCGPDFFNIAVGDGATQTTVFHEVFDNVGAAGQTFHTPGFEVHGNFGFGGSNNDSAYLMSIAALHNIAHTSSTLEIDFFASGTVWQGGADESWGIDEVKVSMETVPEPATLSLLGIGLAGLARRRFRQRA